jgi:hypothetical protein
LFEVTFNIKEAFIFNLSILRGLCTELSILNSSILISYSPSMTSENLFENTLLSLSPWFITGFCDAEGCFTASIIKNNSSSADMRRSSSLGYSIRLAFQVESHSRDLELLESIKNFFNTGKIIKLKNREVYQYRVSTKEGLEIIIKHFYQYPLSTLKRQDFYLFTLLLNYIASGGGGGTPHQRR